MAVETTTALRLHRQSLYHLTRRQADARLTENFGLKTLLTVLEQSSWITLQAPRLVYSSEAKNNNKFVLQIASAVTNISLWPSNPEPVDFLGESEPVLQPAFST
jgi:hypothetical protein